MSKTNSIRNSFPSPYVPNSVKNSFDYGEKVFRAIIDATNQYREKRMRQITESRMYALGRQSLQQYLDELDIEGSKQYVNINYTPTPIVQKFEKIVVDDYVQLEETPKAIARAHHIQERKERRKADLKFRMEFGQQLADIEQMVGFPVEDPNQQVPEDDEELELITSLSSEEREELLMREMLKFVMEDNNVDNKKRKFLSDIFQINFGGWHHYVNKAGKIKVDFVSGEDALFDSSMEEVFNDDISYAGKKTTMTIGDIRNEWDISPEKEHLLYKLAYYYKNDFGNYSLINSNFHDDWRHAYNRPYDDFSVPVYHVWKKMVKNMGYLEGTDSYGKGVFDIDKTIDEVKVQSNGRKRTGVSYIETAYEGWFAGDSKTCVTLEWGEAQNQTREGKNKEKVLCPYIFIMPDNRGTMDVPSAVERVIPEVQALDLISLKIKMTLAKHPPVGYAIDYEALKEVDLGIGDLSPLDIDDIYQQTGKLYFKRRNSDDSINQGLPIIPLDVSIVNTINTYLTVLNTHMNNIRDILGINPNREGTANLSRVSNQLAQTQIAISQTATYYIYRAYLKATELLVKHIGIRVIDVLSYGRPNKGYLDYLGQENIDWVKEREEIIAGNYLFKLDPQMTKEDEERLQMLVNAGVTARELSTPDALLIMSLKDIDLAEKYLRFLYKKNEKEAHQRSIETMRAQSDAQAEGAERAEMARQQTIQIQESLQANQWKIKGETQVETTIMQIAQRALEALHEGKPITPREQELINLVMDDAIVKKEKSMVETEQELQGEFQAQQEDMVLEELGRAVDSGEITELQAQQQLQQMGM